MRDDQSVLQTIVSGMDPNPGSGGALLGSARTGDSLVVVRLGRLGTLPARTP